MLDLKATSPASCLHTDSFTLKMKIILLTQYFHTSESPGIPLFARLARGLCESGYKVFVIASRRGYMDRESLRGSNRHGSLIWQDDWDGITILRPYSLDLRSRRYLARLAGFFSFSICSLLALGKCGSAKIILGSTPPLFPMATGWLWARLTGAKFVLEVRDLWPESAVVLGIVRNAALLWLTERLALFLYRHADGVIALTNGIADHIRTQVQNAPPTIIAPYATAVMPLHEREKFRASLRQELRWEGRCHAVYAGTLGYANGLDLVLEAAEQLQENTNLQMVLIGDGVKRRSLEEKAKRMGLQNVTFLPPLAHKRLLRYLCAADIGLAPLMNAPIFDGAIPTKMLDYMSVGLPVVAPRLREIAEIVETHKCGLLYDPDSKDDLTRILRELTLSYHRRKRMGISGCRAVQERFSPIVRQAKISDFLLTLTDSTSRG